MTGPHDSVIGVETELAIRRMRTGMPVRFETATGGRAPRGRARHVRSGDGTGERDRAGAGSVAGHVSTTRSATRVSAAREHEPRRERVELASRAPSSAPGTTAAVSAQASASEAERGAAPRRRRRAARGAASQTRNCGESTLLNATNATTEAARVAHEPLGRRRAAGERDPDGDDRGDLRDALERRRATSAAVPVRFCEPLPDAQPSDVPKRVVEREQHPGAEALDLERPPELASERVGDAVGRERRTNGR